MKVFGINNYKQNNVYETKKTNNVQKNYNPNILSTKPWNNFSQDKVSFGMKGSGKVNDMRDLIAYVGRNNATQIIKTLQKCRYSKADILTSNKTKMDYKYRKLFLKNFNSTDDSKLRGNCRELMLKAGKEIKENCPDLNVNGLVIFNNEYRMTHCVLAICKKDTPEDTAIKNKSFDENNDILVVDPSFRTYKMDNYKTNVLKYCNIDKEIQIQQERSGMIELGLNEPVIIGSYADIASDLNLPQVSQKFGINAKPPLCAIYNNGEYVKFTMVGVRQNKEYEITQFAARYMDPYVKKFMSNL